MAEMPRIKLPKQASKGEIIEVKTLVAHLMESGQRRDSNGKIVPRKIINRFTCAFNSRPVFECELEPAIAANPYIQFSVKVEESGVFTFGWIDDDGTAITAEEKISVA